MLLRVVKIEDLRLGHAILLERMVSREQRMIRGAIECWKSLIALEYNGFVQSDHEYDIYNDQTDECKRIIDELYGAYPVGCHPVYDSPQYFDMPAVNLLDGCRNALDVLLPTCEASLARELNRKVYVWTLQITRALAPPRRY